MKYPSNLTGKVLVAKDGRCYLATGEAVNGNAPAFKLTIAELDSRVKFYPNDSNIAEVREPASKLEIACSNAIVAQALKSPVMAGDDAIATIAETEKVDVETKERAITEAAQQAEFTKLEAEKSAKA